MIILWKGKFFKILGKVGKVLFVVCAFREGNVVRLISARHLFQQETDYTVAVYTLDEAAFAAGQTEDESYTMDKLWAYSKSGPKKDKYQSLIKVASCDVVKNEKTGEILSFTCTPVE